MPPPQIPLAIRLTLVLFIAAGTLQGLRAGTIALTPVADTTLSQTSPDNNFGGENSMSSGATGDDLINRALLRFDIASNVPSNATIQRVTLTLNVTHPTALSSTTFGLYRMLQGWGEGTKTGGGSGAQAGAGEATWSARFYPGQLWSVAGATSPTDFAASASARQSIVGSGSFVFASSSSLVADVQTWLTNSAANFGWILIADDEVTFDTSQAFASREDASNAPSLVIDYLLPPRPSITLTPVADTSILENDPENNLGRACLISGTVNSSGTGKRSRAFFQFPFSSLPSNVVFTSATLGLTVVQAPGASGGAAPSFALHRMLVSWGEGSQGTPCPSVGGPATAEESNWENRFAPSSPWSVSGGGAPVDFTATVSSRKAVAGQDIYFFTNLLADVQFWLAHPGQNYGWILMAEDEARVGTDRWFGSREDSNPTNAPALVLEYIPVAQIAHSQISGGRFNFDFVAPGGLASVVEYRDSLSSNAAWLPLTNIPPSPVTRTNSIGRAFSVSQPQRFFRVGLQ